MEPSGLPTMMTYEQEKEEKLKLAREKLKQFRQRKKEAEMHSAPPESNMVDSTHHETTTTTHMVNFHQEILPHQRPPSSVSEAAVPRSSSSEASLPPPPPPQESDGIKEQYEIYCQTLSNQVNSLQETISSSQISHREETERMKAAYEEKINDLSSSIQIYVSEKSELSTELEKSQKETRMLREQIQSLETRLQESLSSSAGQFEDIKKLEMKEEELALLRKELSDVNDTVINQRHELSEVTSKLKSKTELAEDFEKKYNETQSQLEMVELNLSQMRNANPDELLAEKNEELAKLRSEVESQEKRVAELTAYIQQSNGERDQIINQYTSYSQQLVAQIEALNKTLTEKLEENSKLVESEKSLLSTVTNLESRLQELMNQQSEAEKKKSSESSQPNEAEQFEDLKNRMGELQISHDQLSEEKGLLVAQVDAQETRIQELNIALEENLLKISSMETEMEMLRSNFEMAPLNSNVNLMESMESDKVAASRAMSQNQELKKQLEELQSALVNLTNAKADLMNELEDLKRKNIFLEKCANESEGVKAIFEEKNRTIKTLSDQLKRLLHEQEQQRLKEKLIMDQGGTAVPDTPQQVSEENKNLSIKLEEAKKEIHSLEMANMELKKQISNNSPLVLSTSSSTTTTSPPPSSVSSDASYVHVEVPDPSEMMNGETTTISKEEASNEERAHDDEDHRRRRHEETPSSVSSSNTTTNSTPVVEDLEEASKSTSSTTTITKNVSKKEEAQVPNLEMDVAHFKLQQKFHDAMKKIADLMIEKDYLEHIVVQLQEETETVGEYITLYQYQRSLQKKSLEEKEKQLQKVCRDREELMSKLDKLQKLLTHFVENKEGNDGPQKIALMNKSYSEPLQASQDVPPEHTPQFHPAVPSSYAESNEDNSMESKETANKILSLLNEIGTNSALKEEFRPWFWGTEAGQLITI